jgi:hypothetical protein
LQAEFWEGINAGLLKMKGQVKSLRFPGFHTWEEYQAAQEKNPH